MTANGSANSVVLMLFAFSDSLSAENSKLSAKSGLPGLPFLESMNMTSCFKPTFFQCCISKLDQNINECL